MVHFYVLHALKQQIQISVEIHLISHTGWYTMSWHTLYNTWCYVMLFSETMSQCFSKVISVLCGWLHYVSPVTTSKMAVFQTQLKVINILSMAGRSNKRPAVKINSLALVRKTPAHQNNGCNNAVTLMNCLLLLNDTEICTISMSRPASVPVPVWDNRGGEILGDENYNIGCSEWGN